jgi:hypothetical protein
MSLTVVGVLSWSLSNIPEAEATCDQAANLAAAGGDVPFVVPELGPAERELESRLLSCLECRPGGLNPATPSRTREWLWRGLSALLGTEDTEDEDVEQPTELAVTEAEPTAESIEVSPA